MQPNMPQIDVTPANAYVEIKVDAKANGAVNYSWAKQSNIITPPAFAALTPEPIASTPFNFFSQFKKRFQSSSYRESTALNELTILARSYENLLVIDDLPQVAKQVRKQRIAVSAITDHVQSAQKYMTVEKAVLRVLSDRLADDNSVFLSFSLNTVSKSSSQQFRDYVTEYLSGIELAKSKIHVSIA